MERPEQLNYGHRTGNSEKLDLLLRYINFHPRLVTLKNSFIFTKKTSSENHGHHTSRWPIYFIVSGPHELAKDGKYFKHIPEIYNRARFCPRAEKKTIWILKDFVPGKNSRTFSSESVLLELWTIKSTKWSLVPTWLVVQSQTGLYIVESCSKFYFFKYKKKNSTENSLALSYHKNRNGCWHSRTS